MVRRAHVLSAEGLGGGFGRALAVLFACFCVLASFGMGNMSQINSIAGNLQAVFRVPPVATGIVLALLTGRVILGGLKRVAAVTEPSSRSWPCSTCSGR